MTFQSAELITCSLPHDQHYQLLLIRALFYTVQSTMIKFSKCMLDLHEVNSVLLHNTCFH